MNRRIRTVKPEFFTDRRLGAFPIEVRFMYLGLISVADDEGRFINSPAALASEVMLADMDADPVAAMATVKRLVGVLAEAKFIHLYEVNGERFGLIPSWSKHQRINRPTASHIPAPHDMLTEGSLNAHGGLTEASRKPHGSLSAGSRIMDHGAGVGSGPPAATTTTPVPRLEPEGEPLKPWVVTHEAPTPVNVPTPTLEQHSELQAAYVRAFDEVPNPQAVKMLVRWWRMCGGDTHRIAFALIKAAEAHIEGLRDIDRYASRIVREASKDEVTMHFAPKRVEVFTPPPPAKVISPEARARGVAMLEAFREELSRPTVRLDS